MLELREGISGQQSAFIPYTHQMQAFKCRLCPWLRTYACGVLQEVHGQCKPGYSTLCRSGRESEAAGTAPQSGMANVSAHGMSSVGGDCFFVPTAQT